MAAWWWQITRMYGKGMVVARWHGDMVQLNAMCLNCETGAWLSQVGDRMKLHCLGMPGAL